MSPEVGRHVVAAFAGGAMAATPFVCSSIILTSLYGTGSLLMLPYVVLWLLAVCIPMGLGGYLLKNHWAVSLFVGLTGPICGIFAAAAFAELFISPSPVLTPSEKDQRAIVALLLFQLAMGFVFQTSVWLVRRFLLSASSGYQGDKCKNVLTHSAAASIGGWLVVLPHCVWFIGGSDEQMAQFYTIAPFVAPLIGILIGQFGWRLGLSPISSLVAGSLSPLVSVSLLARLFSVVIPGVALQSRLGWSLLFLVLGWAAAGPILLGAAKLVRKRAVLEQITTSLAGSFAAAMLVFIPLSKGIASGAQAYYASIANAIVLVLSLSIITGWFGYRLRVADAGIFVSSALSVYAGILTHLILFAPLQPPVVGIVTSYLSGIVVGWMILVIARWTRRTATTANPLH